MSRNTKTQQRRCAFRPFCEKLEDRITPSITPAVATIREAVGATPPAIQGTVDTFRADLGDPVNGAQVGSQGVGRRQINWDGVPDADAANGRFPGDFFNAVSPRGAIFGGDPRLSFQVSADAANPAGTGVRFDNLNGTYDVAFATFSAERLFTPLGNNVFDVEFFIPGSNERATVSGFGAVFTDVDNIGSSKIEFFDVNGQEIFERDILAAGDTDGFLSFLGVTFVGAPVAKVRITAGDAPILFSGSPNDLTQGGANDLVVLDDFIYGEPQPLRNPRVTVGTDAGVATQVQVVDAITGNALADFDPYPGFNGGVRVAMGDVTGDGVDDIITGAGAGGGPHIKVFDGNTFNEIASFFAFAPQFTGGIYVSAGNVNGDANMDIIVGAGPSGGPHVKVINGAQLNQLEANGMISDTALLGSFFAYAPSVSGGVTVAAGDVNGDFLDDIITGVAQGPTHVKAIDATQLNNTLANGQINDAALLASFFAYNPAFLGGVFVAAGDANGDGQVDIITGAGAGGGPHVKVFNGGNSSLILDYFAFGLDFTGGVRVSTANIDNGNAIANVLTATGPGTSATVVFDGAPLTQLDRFFAFGGINQGVFVAGSR